MLGAVLGAELLCAAFVIAGPRTVHTGPSIAVSTPAVAASTSSRALSLPDGRTAQLIDLGAPDGAALLDRIAGELPGATDAVTDFWGPRWRREVMIVVAGSSEQFATIAGGGTGIAATATADRITFAPSVAAMNPTDLRTVLRHELFHYAARTETAVDAPMWLTEGVADFVGRPATARSPEYAPAARSGQLPTEAELTTAGPERSSAYDRAWSFASYVADTYGTDGLRRLYLEGCRQGHPDAAGAVRRALGAGLPDVAAGWRQWHST